MWHNVLRRPTKLPTTVIRLILIAGAAYMLCLLGCAKSEKPSEVSLKTSPEKLYVESQQKLASGDYEQAYENYRQAVAANQKLVDLSHFWNILYAWAISKSEEPDTSLLNAQRQVMLTPKQFIPRNELLTLAVNADNNSITVFGIGLPSKDVSHVGQKRLMAREAAMIDAQSWVARLAMWKETGVEAGFDVSGKVVGVQAVKELRVTDMVYIVKVEAPLRANTSQ